jgi:hypothetical protein
VEVGTPKSDSRLRFVITTNSGSFIKNFSQHRPDSPTNAYFTTRFKAFSHEGPFPTGLRGFHDNENRLLSEEYLNMIAWLWVRLSSCF